MECAKSAKDALAAKAEAATTTTRGLEDGAQAAAERVVRERHEKEAAEARAEVKRAARAAAPRQQRTCPPHRLSHFSPQPDFAYVT